MKHEIETTFQRVLEDWAMMLVEPHREVDASTNEERLAQMLNPNAPCLVASLSFRGAFNGTYRAVCQEPFGKILAANLLGNDPDAISLDDTIAALQELVNVLSGNLLTASYGEDVVFALSSPKVDVRSAKDVAKESGTTVAFTGDGEPVLFQWELDEA